MHKLLHKIKEQRQEQKNSKQFKIGYSRILTNRMTILAWKLFKSDRIMHFGLIIYRLKRDFGFTDFEIANFTGIPTSHISKLMIPVRALMKTEILKEMAKPDYDYDTDEHLWRSKKFANKPQGYFTIKDAPEWYTNSEKARRWRTKPEFQFGGETEKELEDGLKR